MSFVVGINGVSGGIQITGSDYSNQTLSDFFLQLLSGVYDVAQSPSNNVNSTSLQDFQSVVNEMVNIGQNGLSVQTSTNGPNVTYYFTTSQAQVLSQLVATLQAAGVTDLSNITASQLTTWIQNAQSSGVSGANIANIFVTAANLLTATNLSPSTSSQIFSSTNPIASSVLNSIFANAPTTDPSATQSFQSLTEVEYVETANNVLTSNLQDLQNALQTTQGVLASLTSLQDIHNNITIPTRTFNFTFNGPYITSAQAGSAANQANLYATEYTQAASGQQGTPLVPQLTTENTPFAFSTLLTPVVTGYSSKTGNIAISFTVSASAAAALYIASPTTGDVYQLAANQNIPGSLNFQLSLNDNASFINLVLKNLQYNVGDTEGTAYDPPGIPTGGTGYSGPSYTDTALSALYLKLWQTLDDGASFGNSFASTNYPNLLDGYIGFDNHQTSTGTSAYQLLGKIMYSCLLQFYTPATLAGYYYSNMAEVGDYLVGTLSGFASIELQMLQIQSTLTQQVNFLKQPSQTPMSTQNNPTLLSQSLLGTTETVLNELNSALAYFKTAGGGSFSSEIGFQLNTYPGDLNTHSMTAVRNWLMDNYQNFNTPSATNAGALQQNITSAITAAESQNSTQQQKVTNLLYIFQEYYQSASAVLTALSQMIQRMAQNISP